MWSIPNYWVCADILTHFSGEAIIRIHQAGTNRQKRSNKSSYDSEISSRASQVTNLLDANYLKS